MEIWAFAKKQKLLLLYSVTRLDDFWKFLATKFLANEAQRIGNFIAL